jgi:hypothetical protein
VYSLLRSVDWAFSGREFISRSSQKSHERAIDIARNACGLGATPIAVERYVVLVAFLFGSLGALKQSTRHEEHQPKLAPPPVNICVSNARSTHAAELRDLIRRHDGNFNAAGRESGKSRFVFLRDVAKHCPDLVNARLTKREISLASRVRGLYESGAGLAEIYRATKLRLISIYKLSETIPELIETRNTALIEVRRSKLRAKATHLIKQGLNRSEIRRKLKSAGSWQFTFDKQWVDENYPTIARHRISTKSRRKFD